eukprot:s445_g5.t1
MAPCAGKTNAASLVFMQLCPLHGSNKVPQRAKWWMWEDTLRVHILGTAMELLLEIIRPLPISARSSLHLLYHKYWEEISTMLVWQDVWLILRPGQRVLFIRKTYAFDSVFGCSMLDCAYAYRLATARDLYELDSTLVESRQC